MSRNTGINIAGDGMGSRKGTPGAWAAVYGGAEDDEEQNDNMGFPARRTAGASASTGAGAGAAGMTSRQKMREVYGGHSGFGDGGAGAGAGARAGGAAGGAAGGSEANGAYEQGVKMRTQVLGKEYVQKSQRAVQGNEFMGAMVDYATVRVLVVSSFCLYYYLRHQSAAAAAMPVRSFANACRRSTPGVASGHAQDSSSRHARSST